MSGTTYLYKRKTYMKVVIFISAILFTACTARQSEYRKAEDALDAGREFINSRLQGDFLKAGFYMLPSDLNVVSLQETERAYRLKNKEERQNWRTASINIKEVKEVNDSITLIYFQNSFDKITDTVKVVKRDGNWLVDLSKKN